MMEERMRDWFEFLVVVGLASATLAIPLISTLEGVPPGRAVIGCAAAWIGVMFLVRDWGV